MDYIYQPGQGPTLNVKVVENQTVGKGDNRRQVGAHVFVLRFLLEAVTQHRSVPQTEQINILDLRSGSTRPPQPGGVVPKHVKYM